jgi:hypothetical protein
MSSRPDLAGEIPVTAILNSERQKPRTVPFCSATTSKWPLVMRKQARIPQSETYSRDNMLPDPAAFIQVGYYPHVIYLIPEVHRYVAGAPRRIPANSSTTAGSYGLQLNTSRYTVLVRLANGPR